MRERDCLSQTLTNKPACYHSNCCHLDNRDPVGWSVCDCTYVCVRALRVPFTQEVCLSYSTFRMFSSGYLGITKPSLENIATMSAKADSTALIYTCFSCLQGPGSSIQLSYELFLSIVSYFILFHLHFRIKPVLNIEPALNSILCMAVVNKCAIVRTAF